MHSWFLQVLIKIPFVQRYFESSIVEHSSGRVSKIKKKTTTGLDIRVILPSLKFLPDGGDGDMPHEGLDCLSFCLL